MKRLTLFALGCGWLASCQNTPHSDQVISQKYVHKYGFETTEQDWSAREKDGQVVSLLQNGVKLTQSYENGQLHGNTTSTFPHSHIIEKTQVYDQGILLKEQINDKNGMPIRQDIYEFGNRIVTTLWDEKGVPLSIEETENTLLKEGKYFTSDHALEATVIEGNGQKVKRDRSGLLLSKEEIRNGILFSRTTYHPSGEIHTISHYEDDALHGPQIKYTASGRPLMELNWEKGELHGEKIVYRNGYKVAVIPYLHGKKEGKELHYDDLGNLTAEIEWHSDQKHGPAKQITEDFIDTEWFFRGQAVNEEKFQTLVNREKVLADLRD